MVLLLMTILTFLADLLTKLLIRSNLYQGHASLLGKYLQLTYVENRGAAFGIFQGRSLFLILLPLLIIGFLLYFYRKEPRKSPILKIGTGLIIGGALGNLLDRVMLGYVVDFIQVDLVDFYQFPVFNVADIGVTLGTGFLLLFLLLESGKGES